MMASPAPDTAPTVSSPPAAAEAEAVASAEAPITAIPTEPLAQDGNVEVDDEDDDADSSYGSSLGSETDSVHSTIYRGYMQNGRRYSVVADRQYHQPADLRQMDSWNAGHLTLLVLDSQERNPLFHSPVPRSAQKILDIGTGDGAWAVDVAETFPQAAVYGVDLMPPPDNVVPPNCVFELDDVTKPWTWKHKWDLIHMRWMLGSFTAQQWTDLYAQAYSWLQPGGWIEHIEPSVIYRSDDGSLPSDSLLADWGQKFERMGAKAGRPFNTFNTMRVSIEGAGFTNVQEKIYKVPIGTWPKHRLYKDAGRLNEEQFRAGMEGYALYMLTHIGDPEPMSAEAVQMYLAGIRKELEERKWHKYILNRRVWAMKPFEKAEDEVKDTVA